MKCYQCKKSLREHWASCPYCGKLAHMTSKKMYMLTLAESAQANRIEEKLNLILKSIGKSLPFSDKHNLHCLKCNYKWMRRMCNRLPDVCPKCKRHDWKEPRMDNKYGEGI